MLGKLSFARREKSISSMTFQSSLTLTEGSLCLICQQKMLSFDTSKVINKKLEHLHFCFQFCYAEIGLASLSASF